MRDFDDKLASRLKSPVTATDTTTPSQAIQAAYESLDAQLDEALEQHAAEINRLRGLNLRLEELMGRGATVEEINALKTELTSSPASLAPSPPGVKKTPPVPAPPGGAVPTPQVRRADLKAGSSTRSVRDWLRHLFADEPVQKPTIERKVT